MGGRAASSRRPRQPPKRRGRPAWPARRAGRRGWLIVQGGWEPRLRVGGESKRPRAGNAFAHVPRNVPRKAAAQQVTLVAWGCGHVQLATLSPGPHFRLRCSGLVCVAAALWLALLDGMTEAGRCSDGAEQPPLAPSIKGGAADVLCLAAPRVRRHSPPPLLILVQAGQISPTPVCDTRDAAGPGGGEAIHTAAMWVMYPSYGSPRSAAGDS